jgi:hypothetical protein
VFELDNCDSEGSRIEAGASAEFIQGREWDEGSKDPLDPGFTVVGGLAMRTSRNGLLDGLAVGMAICWLLSGPIGAEAYDGPSFTKGLWLFQRSTEFYTKHWLLPNARRVQVERPVVRCVDPTEAMIETFRTASVGACQPSLPRKEGNKFVFAKRCDFMGPVKTTISVESETAYREMNELLVGNSPKRELVVARRVGDCGATPNLGEVNASAADSFASSPAAQSDRNAAQSELNNDDLNISAARRPNPSAEAPRDQPGQ